MELQRLTLSCFRNYKKEEAIFLPGLNGIRGVNGSGKSNLLEAIHLLSTGKSFRTNRLLDLIQHEEKELFLEAVFCKDTISHTLRISYTREGIRKMWYNETTYATFLPLLGTFPSVFLCPEDIAIIDGSPAERRRFLDLHCAQIAPLYVHHLGRYQRALKQRNLLLKLKEEKGIAPWEEIMAISAMYLMQKRFEALSYLEKPSKDLVLHLSEQQEPFAICYKSSLAFAKEADPSFYITQWEQVRAKEFYAGSTALGPHRDDISFLISDKEVKTYCSEGQKRCCLAALRLGQWRQLQEILGTPPLFGVDDFGIHLDERRSALLHGCLQGMGQVFLTAPHFTALSKAHVLHTQKGSLSCITHNLDALPFSSAQV